MTEGIKLTGTKRKEILTGTKGDDTLGGLGDDTLLGRGTLNGGEGADILNGSGKMIGGNGNDQINATFNLGSVGDDVVIDLGKGDQLTLQDVDLTDLGRADFIF